MKKNNVLEFAGRDVIIFRFAYCLFGPYVSAVEIPLLVSIAWFSSGARICRRQRL